MNAKRIKPRLQIAAHNGTQPIVNGFLWLAFANLIVLLASTAFVLYAALSKGHTNAVAFCCTCYLLHRLFEYVATRNNF